MLDDRTITLTAIDPLQDAPGTDDDLVIPVGELSKERGVLIVRAGAQAGSGSRSTPTSPGSAAIPTARSPSTTSPSRAATPRCSAPPTGYMVADSGSLNGTYVNQERVERAAAAPRRRTADRQVPAGVLRARPMPEATEASYLSIGEVLGLLLEEFPDVTISKIRFLESQGLISPERTASGYRKFYDDDVELLRVILTEQRSNYLPLRVIKDRLDSGEIDPTGEHSRPERRSNAPPDESSGRGSRRRAERRPHAAADDPARASVARRIRRSRGKRLTEPRATAAATPTSSGSRVRQRPSRPPTCPQLLPGVLLDRAELCAMVGITDAELEQLESFGIVHRRSRATPALYGDDAVAIAKPAVRVPAAGRRRPAPAQLAHGGRARGVALRTARHAAVPPAQPRGAGRGARPAATLDQLGGELRAALTRQALRHHFESLTDRAIRTSIGRSRPRVMSQRDSDGARRRAGRDPGEHADGAAAGADGEHRLLPIMIGGAEASAIHDALEGIEPPRPLTHDLFVDVLDELGTTLDKVVVTEVPRPHVLRRTAPDHAGAARRSCRAGRPTRSPWPCAFGAPLFADEDLLDEVGQLPPPRAGRRGGRDHRRVQGLHRHVSPEDFALEPRRHDLLTRAARPRRLDCSQPRNYTVRVTAGLVGAGASSAAPRRTEGRWTKGSAEHRQPRWSASRTASSTTGRAPT